MLAEQTLSWEGGGISLTPSSSRRNTRVDDRGRRGTLRGLENSEKYYSDKQPDRNSEKSREKRFLKNTPVLKHCKGGEKKIGTKGPIPRGGPQS